jgi:diguanylate cyclase (GGDEF)-like protein
MKSSRSDRDLVSSILAEPGRHQGRKSPGLVELAEAYTRLEDRLDKIIAIGDKYQAESLENAGRLRVALERLERLERPSGTDAASVIPAAPTLCKGRAEDEAGGELPEMKRIDPLAERIGAAVMAGRADALSIDDIRLLLRRYGRLEARLDKIVRISDGYQSQLRDATMRMEFLARTDPLTGLSNRRDTMERLDSELSRLDRYGTIFSVVIFDLDDFKRVNDLYGHNTGDQTLRMVARVFGSELRKTDLCGRWGGEEFLIICPATERAEAFTVAEKCKRAVAADRVETKSGEVRITMSGGVCAAEKGLDLDTLIRRADDALYRAKGSGKNTIVEWGSHAPRDDGHQEPSK